MILLGFSIGLTLFISILWLFVERPYECGEPSSCGDDYLFPGLPIAVLALLATTGFAVIISKDIQITWRTFCLKLCVWTGSAAIAIFTLKMISAG